MVLNTHPEIRHDTGHSVAVPVVVSVALDVLTAALLGEEARLPRLSDDERRTWTARLSGPRGVDDANAWAASRIATRFVLESVVGERSARDVRRVPFDVSTSGKPHLPASGCHFSLSHCDGHALIAVSKHGEIGVDVERRRPLAFSLANRQRLIALAQALTQPVSEDNGADAEPGAADDASVLTAWVAIEAFAKASGTGVGRLLEAGRRPSDQRANSALAPFEAWRAERLRLEPDVFAAVAVLRSEAPLRVLQLAMSADGGLCLQPGI